MKTKLVAMLLIVALLWETVPGDWTPNALAETDRIIMLPCASNMCDDWQVEVYVDERQGFISEEAAARFSGFTYLGGSTTTAYYERAGEEVAVPVAAEYEAAAGSRWSGRCICYTQKCWLRSGVLYSTRFRRRHTRFSR